MFKYLLLYFDRISKNKKGNAAVMTQLVGDLSQQTATLEVP